MRAAARALRYRIAEPLRYGLELRRISTADPWEARWRVGDPLVTVYIPTFNRAEMLLGRALPSVIGQSYRNLEIIVAAHGCTDDTARRVRGMIPAAGIAYGPPQDHRLKLIEVPRVPRYPATAENHWLAGPVDPCNAALRAARGDWIMRIDDDDMLKPDAVEALLRFAQAGNHEFVSAAYEIEREGRLRETVFTDDGVPPAGGVQTWLYRSYLRFMRYNPDCWRKRVNRVNDTDLLERFRRLGVRMGWTPQAVCTIRPRPGETEIGSRAYLADAARTEARMAF